MLYVAAASLSSDVIPMAVMTLSSTPPGCCSVGPGSDRTSHPRACKGCGSGKCPPETPRALPPDTGLRGPADQGEYVPVITSDGRDTLIISGGGVPVIASDN